MGAHRACKVEYLALFKDGHECEIITDDASQILSMEISLTHLDTCNFTLTVTLWQSKVPRLLWSKKTEDSAESEGDKPCLNI